MATKETGPSQEPAYKAFETAFNAYATDVNAANDKLQRALLEAQNACTLAVQDAQTKRSCQALDQARTEYERATRAALKDHDPKARVVEAFKSYRSALQHAFGGADLERLDPAALAAIAKSMIAIASHVVQTQTK